MYNITYQLGGFMDKIESLKEINKSIKGLTNQRNSEALDMVGFNENYLSKDINSLKTLRAIVSDNYNILEDTSKEEFESDVATRKYVKK